MNVQTITMPKAEAQKAFREYRASVHARASAEELALIRGYRELAKGHNLLDVGAIMKEIGTDQLHRPKLAIIRADAKFCWFHGQDRGAGYYSSASDWGRKQDRISFPEGTFPLETCLWQRSLWRGNQDIAKGMLKAVVPLVPPPLQPQAHLRNYHLLWEVESWGLDPPKDPILCKHLAGMLYAVIAQWDLSPLERAILRGRE